MAYGGNFPFPNTLQLQIGTLERGDQIIVLMGEGFPKVERDTIDIVWKVTGYNALTAGGITINAQTITKLVRTGQHFEDFLASEQAKAIWEQAQADLPDDLVKTEPE